MPATRVAALETRAAHEGREVAHAPADLAGGGAEQEEIVGGGERIAGRERALDLAGAPLVLDRAQRQREPFERVGERAQHRLHQVHVGFGVVRKAGLGRTGADRAAAYAGCADMLVAELILRDAEEIPLDLEPDHIAHALVGETPQLSAQEMPRREVEWHAAVEILVAQD